MTVGDKVHRPIRHDVMFDETQISLAARVVAFVMGSQGDTEKARLAGALERVGAVFRSSGNKTAIETSNRLMRWAEQCRSGKVPKTKCVKALSELFAEVDGTSGSWVHRRKIGSRFFDC